METFSTTILSGVEGALKNLESSLKTKQKKHSVLYNPEFCGLIP